MRKLIALSLLALLVSAPAASALEAGDGLYAIQVTNGIADLHGLLDGNKYITAYDHSEVGVGFQYWRLMSKDYAFTLAAGLGYFSETDKPGTGAPAGSTDFKYTQDSWSVRVGGDRVVQVGERGIVYFGPGLEYWTGKAKFAGGAAGGPFATAVETEAVTRIGISGRVGGIMMLTDRVGFNCQVGRYVGYASATEKGAKATWWPSGFQGSGGLVFKF